MFKGRIISRSNINGKVHTFQKDFDDQEDYQDFLLKHPEYNSDVFLPNFLNPFPSFENVFPGLSEQNRGFSLDPKHLPNGVDLNKYEQRRQEKRQLEKERSSSRRSLEEGKAYLEDYIHENPEDNDAREDLKKIEEELKTFKNTSAK